MVCRVIRGARSGNSSEAVSYLTPILKSVRTYALFTRIGLLPTLDFSGMITPELSEEQRPAYSDEHIAAYPVEYIAGIDLYNEQEFHAAHDAWEDRWMGPVGPREKLFLQAMIQSAVAFHHLDIGRPGAARRMYQMAKEKFARLGTSVFMSLDLDEYQAQLDHSLDWLTSGPDPREITRPEIEPPFIRLKPGVTEFD